MQAECGSAGAIEHSVKKRPIQSIDSLSAEPLHSQPFIMQMHTTTGKVRQSYDSGVQNHRSGMPFVVLQLLFHCS